jgi:hypothetical protein
MSDTHSWTFDVRCAASDAATGVAGDRNDDAYGCALQRLWVLDGATGVSPRRCTRDSSDAAWLAETAGHWLAADTRTPRSTGPLAPRLLELQRFVQDAFSWEQQQTGGTPPDDIDMPCACLGVAQIEGDHLRLACVGDINVVVAWPDGRHQTWSDQASTAAAALTLRAWHAAREQGLRGDALWETVRPVILRNRETVNRPDGYRVIHPKRPWAEGVQVHHIPLIQGMRVLLASDGLWRLVDLFNSHSALDVLQAIDTHGWPTVLTELRALEDADTGASRYARVKHRDDATAVLAHVRHIAKPAQ